MCDILRKNKPGDWVGIMEILSQTSTNLAGKGDWKYRVDSSRFQGRRKLRQDSGI